MKETAKPDRTHQPAGDEPENLDPLDISQAQFHRARAHLDDLKRGLNAREGAAATNGDEARETPADRSPIDLRTAARVVAIRRVARVTLQRGIWP